MLNEHTHLAPWQIRLETTTGWNLRHQVSQALYPLVKQWLDILISISLLILLAPFILMIAIAIKLDSPGPVIYIQRRSGLGGRVFDFYKFRSMTNGHNHTEEHRQFAEAYIKGNASTDQQDTNGHTIYKPVSNGYTVTRVGQWLRRTSLDELPQLINVIKGDMSLVGPRPSIDYEVALYNERHWKRLAVLPGLTGWAQINGRSRLSFDEIVDLDLEYIRKRSSLWDLQILLNTVTVVLSAEDAG
ncbi:MAG: UDP-phosphate galactose phosphotransferase [Candidatus Anoxymicrobium japonicum]|uniref:UDP-phosphate galactose phosphotransferase n=1 Tax=Candidatus Anoxymicrobium japonicum TaxID=2013648 RepID=A0A2N3G6E9_9ACTN|nr:MAG: UDP-phosphate galactose phosphotransferase [Candidatus Anoxymicrobium japonicum]